MTATEFLYVLVALTLASLLWDRRLMCDKGRRLLQLLLFMAVSAFWFDYVANHRTIWWFEGDWQLVILLNPLENTLFAIVMTILVLQVYLGWARYIAMRNR